MSEYNGVVYQATPTHPEIGELLRQLAAAGEALATTAVTLADAFEWQAPKVPPDSAMTGRYGVITVTCDDDPEYFYPRVDTRDVEEYRDWLKCNFTNQYLQDSVLGSVRSHGLEAHRFTLVGRYATRTEAISRGRELQRQHNAKWRNR